MSETLSRIEKLVFGSMASATDDKAIDAATEEIYNILDRLQFGATLVIAASIVERATLLIAKSVEADNFQSDEEKVAEIADTVLNAIATTLFVEIEEDPTSDEQIH